MGTDSDLAARLAVQKLGLAEKDVSIIAMGTDTERLSATEQGGSMPQWDDRRFRRGAEARLPLDIEYLSSERSLRDGVDDHHAHVD